MEKIQTHSSESRSENGIKFIYLKGSLDTYNAEDVKAYIEHVLQNTEEKTVLFDLKELEFITAQGIGVLVNIFNNKENMYMMNVNTKIAEMFDLLGFRGCCQFISKVEDIGIEDVIFPKTIQCPSCKNKFEVFKSGRFKCASCKTVVSIDKKGNIYEKD